MAILLSRSGLPASEVLHRTGELLGRRLGSSLISDLVNGRQGRARASVLRALAIVMGGDGDGERFAAYLLGEEGGDAVGIVAHDIAARLDALGFPGATVAVQLLALGEPERWAGALLGDVPKYTDDQRQRFLLAFMECVRVVLAQPLTPSDVATSLAPFASLLDLLGFPQVARAHVLASAR